MREYYVYIHLKKSDFAPFYVGKGKGKRHLVPYSRNQHWTRTVAKHGFISCILHENLPEECALTLERIAIAAYGRANLVNLDNGGRSGDGRKMSEQTIQKQREKKLTPEHKANVSKALLEYYSCNPAKPHTPEQEAKRLASVAWYKPSEKTKAIMREKHAGRKHPQFDWTVYSFSHAEHGRVDCLRSELIERYGLSPPKVCNIISGKRKTHQGWSMIA